MSSGTLTMPLSYFPFSKIEEPTVGSKRDVHYGLYAGGVLSRQLGTFRKKSVWQRGKGNQSTRTAPTSSPCPKPNQTKPNNSNQFWSVVAIEIILLIHSRQCDSGARMGQLLRYSGRGTKAMRFSKAKIFRWFHYLLFLQTILARMFTRGLIFRLFFAVFVSVWSAF